MPVSNDTAMVPIAQVYVPEDRQRKNLDEAQLKVLADSMRRIGLIHPIVINRMHVLVAGERRLKAAQMLQWTHIRATYQDELSKEELEITELEENIKRENLTWQEQVDAITRLHNRLCQTYENWTQEKTGLILGVDQPWISRNLRIGEEAKKNPDILKASGAAAAANSLERRASRDAEATLMRFLDVEEGREATDSSKPYKVELGDFLQWSKTYNGPLFNLVHCDFPYGIKMDTSNLQGTRADLARYADGKELYFALCESLIASKDRLLAPSAHILFWFSLTYYSETVQLFASNGFAVNPFPLVWVKEDQKGIIPDPQRGPRRIYETALLMSLGDRKIVKPVNNAFVAPTNKAEALHLSEKPEAVVSYFLSMLVDGSTRLLDPTCGAGSALSAGLSLGAEAVHGVDISVDNVENSKTRISKGKLISEIEL